MVNFLGAQFTYFNNYLEKYIIIYFTWVHIITCAQFKNVKKNITEIFNLSLI